MDPPPPYDTVTRSSTSGSVRSVDRLNPDHTDPDQMQPHQTPNNDATRGAPVVAAANGGSGGIAVGSKNTKYRQDGGCCKQNGSRCLSGNIGGGTDDLCRIGNYGHDSGGCMVRPVSFADGDDHAMCIADLPMRRT